MRTVKVVVLLAALCARHVGAQATTTTVAVTTTTSSTTTTLPPSPASTLCTCNASKVCEVKKGTYPVNPGSNLDFGTCALTGAQRRRLRHHHGHGRHPARRRATINVDTQDAGASEIDLTAGSTITLEGGAGTNVLSAKALGSDGDGGDQGGGGDICITTNNAKVTLNGPLDASGGEFDGGCSDVESDLDLTTTATAKLKVDGGNLSGSGGQIILDANVQGPVIDRREQRLVRRRERLPERGRHGDGGGGNQRRQQRDAA